MQRLSTSSSSPACPVPSTSLFADEAQSTGQANRAQAEALPPPIDEDVVRSSEAQYRYEVHTFYSVLPDAQYVEEARRIRLSRLGLLNPQEGQAAKHRVIQGYLWLAEALASRWVERAFLTLGIRLDVLDLIQAGNLALIAGVEAFSFHDTGERALAVCLKKRINGAIIHEIYATAFSMRLPTPGNLADDMQTSVRGESIYQHACSLDGGDEEDDLPLSERLTAPVLMVSTDPQECPQHKALFLGHLLAALPPRERQAVQLLYGLGEDRLCYSLEDAAAVMGITRHGVHLLERAAHERLKAIYDAYARETGRSLPYLSYDEELFAYLAQRRWTRVERRRANGSRNIQPRVYTQETRARVERAFSLLMQTQRKPPSQRQLAEAAQVSKYVARRFLEEKRQLLSQPVKQISGRIDVLACAD